MSAPSGFDVTRQQRLDVGSEIQVTVLETLSPVESRSTRGAILPRYTLVGKADAPVVVVLGGISASREVTGATGWWKNIAGDGLAIDTREFRVLGLDFMDGGRDASGRPRRAITTHDQALWLERVLRSIGIQKTHAIVGSSYGGMVALAFAERFSTCTNCVIAFSAPHEAHPMSIALRTLQRRIVELGIETGRSEEAMSIARGLAMTTYRSAGEFAERFSAHPVERTHNDARFDVDNYLRDRGDRFAAITRPERYLALSLSSDLHRVDPARIDVETTLIAAEGDTIVPLEQLEALATRLPRLRQLVHLPTRVGHDAFLVETARVSSILSAALS